MDRLSLCQEFRLFAFSLIKTIPSQELCARYADAAEIFFAEPLSKADRTAMSLIHRFPIMISYLDAFDGLFRRQSLLHRKLLLSLSLLETSTDHVNHFEWQRSSRLRWIMTMAVIVFRQGVDLVVGCLLSGLLLVLDS